jgi:hypothetical protein
MDHIFRGKPVSAGNHGLTGPDAAYAIAFCLQLLRPSRREDGAAHPSAHQQFGIGCVNYRVSLQFCNISLYYLKWHSYYILSI